MNYIRIVVVDDSEVFLESICDFIGQMEGFEVSGSAASADEGLRLIERLKPDLVLMDVAMPGKNGLEATKLIRRDAGRPMVIMMSALTGPAISQAAIDAGADAYIEKEHLYSSFPLLAGAWFGEAP